jgi:hypothetical protein
MQNVIGRHIFHVIKAHDLTQHIYDSNFVSEKINVEDNLFLNLSQWEKRVQEKVQVMKHQR